MDVIRSRQEQMKERKKVWIHKIVTLFALIVSTPRMHHSSKIAPTFEGKLNRKNLHCSAHYKDKCKVELGAI